MTPPKSESPWPALGLSLWLAVQVLGLAGLVLMLSEADAAADREPIDAAMQNKEQA